MYTHPRSPAGIWLAFASGLILFAAGLAQAGQAEAKTNPLVLDEVYQDLVKTIRKACAHEPALRGILIKAVARDPGGELLADLVVDRKEQAQLLREAGQRILTAKATWRNSVKGIVPRSITVVPVRNAFLKDMQDYFATWDWPDQRERTVLRRTRLDDVYYDEIDGNLTFVGASIVVPMASTGRSNGEPTEPADQRLVIGKVLKELLDKKFHFPQLTKLGTGINVKQIALVASPVVELQDHFTRDVQADDVLFQDAWYDKHGTLCLQGYVGKAEHLSQADALLSGRYASRPVLAPFAGRDKRPWSLSSMREVDWRIKPKAFQSQFAADAKSLFSETRLDRVYFAYSDDESHVLELRFEGVSCHGQLAKEEKRAKIDLAVRLTAECYRSWPELKSDVRPSINVGGIVFTPQPRSALQNRIAGVPALDGVRIDDGAFFDKGGRLCLKGLWLGAQQENDLRALVKKVYDGQAHRPDREGLALDRMEEVRTDELLKELREWAAAELEDVRLDRLYFNRLGDLRLKGFYSHPADDQKVKARLLKMIKAHPFADRLSGSGTAGHPVMFSRVALQPAPEPGPDIELDQRADGLADHLRKLVQVGDNPKWDGVLIERCYYGLDGTYTLTGLVSRTEQKHDLQALLSDLASKARWRRFLAGQWSVGRLEVIPIQPMLEALRRVMPEYSELDGLRIDRAYHDQSRNMVLAGYAFGNRRLGGAEKLLKELLGTHAQWRRRAAGGVSLKGLSPRKIDENVAQLALSRSIELLYKNLPAGQVSASTSGPGACIVGYWRGGLGRVAMAPDSVIGECVANLDVALLHTPEESAAWFLRGMCYMAGGDAVAAARDLRRMVAIENRTPYARESRCAKLELIQGDWRMAASEMADRVTIDLGRGRTLMSLADRR